MPSTFSCMYVHVVFATKDRAAWIHSDWRNRFHAFLVSVISERDAIPVSIGGVADHVHLLMRLKPLHCVANLTREIKAVSFKWIHDEQLEPAFAWQEGYGVFTVSHSSLEAVVHYIENQEEHHRTRSAEEEFRNFLIKPEFHCRRESVGSVVPTGT